ncbi:MAG: DUF4465 domain-containing protein [Bacteroidota bacterium]|jgi:hypothetical protein|nr:DUF4465 domain-containing protein [Sphingobacteriales bacterium]
MKKLITILFISQSIYMQAQSVSTFEKLQLPPGGYLNASGEAVKSNFSSGNIRLPNIYETEYGGYWSAGWAYSNLKNDTVGGYTNLYSSFAAAGHQASVNYAVGQGGSILYTAGADAGDSIKGLYVTNSTYAALSMKNGDAFAKKFGGQTGNDPDYFALVFKAWKNGTLKNDSIVFYLADFRFANNALDYIIKNWTYVDLRALGKIDSLRMQLISSDTGFFGMNTPSFFCVDDIITTLDTADFENLPLVTGSYQNKSNAVLRKSYQSELAFFPSTYTVSEYGDYWSSGFAISSVFDTVTPGYGNLYTSFAGLGADSSIQYAISQNRSRVLIPTNILPIPHAKGMYVTNTTYAALSMKFGDAFAKKFGGPSGNDPDYLLLTVKAFLGGTQKADSVNFYLADFRNADNSKDYILNTWKWLNLTPLGLVDSLEFILSSSDNGAFGMNTPAFFALDNLTIDFSNLVNELQLLQAVKIYPNPATEKLFIDASDDLIHAVSLHDLSGRQLLEKSFNQASEISLQGIPAGLYLLKLQGEEKSVVKKIMIK